MLPFTYIPPWRYAESGGLGGDITGLSTDNNMDGKFMSGDGNIIAIPIYQAGYGPNTGQYLDTIYTDVIYSFNGTTWIQIASQTTQNSNYRNYTVFSFENNIIKRFLVLNGNLTNVIISTLTNGTFVQDSAQISQTAVENSLEIPNSGAFFSKRARAVSADGKVVLFVKEKSKVLFKYNGTTWQQYGNVILFTYPSWNNNYISKLSYDGSVFLANSFQAVVNGAVSGMIKIYAYDSSSNTWIQRGQDIIYEEVTLIDESRFMQLTGTFISGDGLTFGISTLPRPGIVYNEGDNRHGLFQAYRYSSISNYWSKVGREITGIAQERIADVGSTGSSYNGNIIYVGGGGDSFRETTTSANTGRLRVYEIEI
jgi:hypothetical protein